MITNNHLIKLPEILESQVINITVIGLLIFSILCNNLYWGGYVQVNLFQKYLFLHQLTHIMTKDCPLNYQFST